MPLSRIMKALGIKSDKDISKEDIEKAKARMGKRAGGDPAAGVMNFGEQREIRKLMKEKKKGK